MNELLRQLAIGLEQFAQELLGAIRGAGHAELDRLFDKLPSLTEPGSPHTPPGLPLSFLDLGGGLIIAMAALWEGGRGLVGSLIDLFAVGAGMWAGGQLNLNKAELCLRFRCAHPSSRLSGRLPPIAA